ncbi:unnamed protein product [Menidia menidia]|uniref:(Atlantic silverside) hypothetical protein n=1 Tax=Menidia menidia TaxID=238744 RepID=A0A8S4A7H2_9TELE|nr:unnamed protein product [Menidia menidia]
MRRASHRQRLTLLLPPAERVGLPLPFRHGNLPKTAMSGFDSNPFADPVDVNPFQVTSRGEDTVGEFNPFSAATGGNHSGTTIPVSTTSSQPAILHTSVEQSTQATAAAAQANLIKQQEELERKAAELERKEQELQKNLTSSALFNDFEEEIPEDYRRLCKRIATLFLNVLACLAYFTADSQYGVDFGLSILCGWISSISMIRTNLAVAVVMMVVAGFFTVHGKYRRTGASFTKAQQEFSQGVLTNRSFQSAAATAATSAAQGSFGGNQGN